MNVDLLCKDRYEQRALRWSKDWALSTRSDSAGIQIILLGFWEIIRCYVCWFWTCGSLKTCFFPTCQVRVVRFYVSLFSFSFSSASSSASSSVTLSCRDSVSSVWHAGAQLRSCEFSVACWTTTAILVSAVWRAGPQPRSCVFSVACRTPTVISWVQCCVPDLNCDSARSVWHAGPQLRLCEFSVACRTSPVMERIGSSCRKSVSKK